MCGPVNARLLDGYCLRRLAEEQAEVAALPVHQEKAELWRRLNDFEPIRPMVWFNEIPWHEMDVKMESFSFLFHKEFRIIYLCHKL